MRIFSCPSCGERLFFGNLACACGSQVAFDPEADGYVPLGVPCANRGEIGCEWVAEQGGLCRSCAMTEVIPDAFHGENRWLWAEAEQAKRWVLANLARWGWFTGADAGPRPVFHLLAERTATGEVPVSMGHAAGVLTISVTEADPAVIVRRRVALGEPARTMIGHFRHELAHFFFERLARREAFTQAFRATFGDERADYAAALDAYYRGGPAPGWESRHVTAYASAHPHEDWAESLAHLLHLTDIADSFVAAGLGAPALPASDYDAYAEDDAERLITAAAGLGIALNHVNRAMGLSDLYPFVLAPQVRAKLGFVHARIRGGPGGAQPEAA